MKGVNVIFINIRVLVNEVDNLIIGIGSDLKTHHLPFTTKLKSLFKNLHKVIRFFLFNGDISITCYTKGCVFYERVARKKFIDMFLHKTLNRNINTTAKLDKTVQYAWNSDDSEAFNVFIIIVTQFYNETKAEVVEVWKRVCSINGNRDNNRVNVFIEILINFMLFLIC